MPKSTPSKTPTGDTDTGGQGCAEQEQVNMEATPSEEVATQVAAQVVEDMESSSSENNSEPQQKPACSEAKIDQLDRNKEPSTPEGTPAKVPSENKDKSLAKVDRKTTPHEVGDEKEEAAIAEEEEEGLNKSKRVSGQGMERQKENRTPPPKTKKFHNIRAVSTPQANKTMMASNVTLAIDESLELSRITVLSPPSIVNGEVSKRLSRSGGAQSKKDDTDAVSFRFRRGSKDKFEELVEVGKTYKEVGKTNKGAPKEKKRKRKTSEGEEGGKKV